MTAPPSNHRHHHRSRCPPIKLPPSPPLPLPRPLPPPTTTGTSARPIRGHRALIMSRATTGWGGWRCTPEGGATIPVVLLIPHPVGLCSEMAQADRSGVLRYGEDTAGRVAGRSGYEVDKVFLQEDAVRPVVSCRLERWRLPFILN